VEKWDNSRSGFPAITSPHTFHSSFGSLAMLTAMRHASSFGTARRGATIVRRPEQGTTAA
jgi:hypothetical protein